MKNAALIKSKTDSPKTPGGISKALLTPCRRVGLSRNWRKSGPSPFQSPLSTSDIKQEEVNKVDKRTRKRKDVCDESENSQENEKDIEKTPPIGEVSTPVRNVELPRRKKSKTLLSTLNSTSNHENLGEQTRNDNDEDIKAVNEKPANIEESLESPVKEILTTPVRLKSKSKSKKKSPVSKILNNKASKSTKENVDANIETSNTKNETSESNTDTNAGRKEVKSPNNLTKECIVVIQKKIFKEQLNDNKDAKLPEKTSQTLFDSDSDDMPLCQINKEDNKPNLEVDKEEEDFEIVKKNNSKKLTLTIKLKKGNSKTQIPNKDDIKKESPSKSKKTISKTQNIDKTVTQNLQNNENCKKVETLHTETISKPKNTKSKTEKPEIKTQITTQNSDEDDDFVEQKRTIIIKKTYDKNTKPIKAKSTGSITQKDIDDLKSRIEKKKKQLLAKAMTEETKELRELIKKWQKGCQDAIMELMDLMKTKMPDKNMDYSEMLKTLKIPAHLVGYDSENDSFCTPDDENIILANLGD